MTKEYDSKNNRSCLGGATVSFIQNVWPCHCSNSCSSASNGDGQVQSCGMCGAQSGIGTGFLEVRQFPLLIMISPRGPLSLVSTNEELLQRKNSDSCLEIREYCRRGSAALTTRHPLYRQKFVLTSPTSGGRSVGIVRSRTKATYYY
jgi:hypothetical protein